MGLPHFVILVCPECSVVIALKDRKSGDVRRVPAKEPCKFCMTIFCFANGCEKEALFEMRHGKKYCTSCGFPQ